ncbi:hypothetical protein QOK74_08600 [Staphylococcus saprophyticus]|nr:hypothetical protein [Staphylococcus saprophyticus]
MVVLYITGKLGLNIWGALIFGIIGLLILAGQWDSAQKDNKKKTEKEVSKMKGKELK